MSERLFFALWPDALVRRGLQAIQSELPCHRAKVTHPQDMHITLVFLGDVDTERRASIEAAVGRIVAPVFDLVIDQVDFWGRPRILWCGPVRTPAALKSLVRDLGNVLQDCGFEPEQRPYRAHITLARKARPARFRSVAHPLLWSVREFVLVASRTGGEPPRYQVLRRWVLVGPADPVHSISLAADS